jgi:DNA-binding FrmR family transcriptional regulator
MTADERFDRIDQALERMNQRFDRVDERFVGIDRSIEAQGRSIEALTQIANALTQSVNTLTGYLLDFREEVIKRFQTIDNRLEVFSAGFSSFDSRIPALTKGIIDLGAGASQFEREQWKQRDTAFELAMRVAKLEQIVSKLVPAA